MTEGEAEQGSSANPLAFDDDDEVHVLSDDDDDDDVGAPPPAKKAKKADDLPPRACRARRPSELASSTCSCTSGTDSPAERTTPLGHLRVGSGLEPNLTLRVEV